MKKFKQVFYSIYIIMALILAYFSFDRIMNPADSFVRINERFMSEEPPTGILFFLFLISILMLVEVLVENIHLRKVKKTIPKLEEEIVRLKAKLYDQSAREVEDYEDEGED